MPRFSFVLEYLRFAEGEGGAGLQEMILKRPQRKRLSIKKKPTAGG
jgi:hypothetical protein